MIKLESKWGAIARESLLLIPCISLALNALSWLRYGIDLPMLDDWRAYAQQNATSLRLSDLFTPSNDTMSPVGIALNALAQRYLAGNSVAYQLISMMSLLGSLLWIQWRLLSSALEDRLLAASAFSLTIFMLQPGTYWGMQNLAYHQGLPILFVLGSLAVILDDRLTAWLRVAASFALGLLSGFSYISGAFAVVVTALVLLSAAAFSRTLYGSRLASGGSALLLAGCVTVGAQLWVIIAFQHGRIHVSDAPWALPIEADFWLFLLGKIGRSLALPTSQPIVSLILVLALVLVIAGLTMWLIISFVENRFQARREAKVGLIFVALSAVCLAYLTMLSAGRANLRPVDVVEPLKVFSFGFANYYHFFWVTLLWPWVPATMFVLASHWAPAHFFRRRSFVFAIPSVALCYAVAFGVFNHSGFYKNLEAWRINTQVKCLQAALDQGAGIECPALYPWDLAEAYRYGRSIGASFTRYFALKPIPLGTDIPAPVFRLSKAPPEALQLVNTHSSKHTHDGLEVEAASDPMLIVAAPSNSLMHCHQLQVSILVRAAASDTAQLFFLAKGQHAYTEQASATASYPGRESTYALVTLEAASELGFEDRLRIDIGTQAQHFSIKEMEVRCRL